MRVLGRLSIRARLYFGTAFSLALLVLVGGMGYVSLDRTRTTLQVLFAERVQTAYGLRLRGCRACLSADNSDC